MNKIEQIRKRVFGKGQEWTVIDTWDLLMKEYGFLPLEYLLEMDQAILNELLQRIEKRREKEKKELNKSKKSK